MTAKIHPLPAKPGSRSAKPPPPAHLAKPEAGLWLTITAERQFGDAASLAILAEGLAAHQRCRECREAIARDGAALSNRWGELRAHPLLVPENHARASFLAAMRLLHLDAIEVVDR